MELKGTGVDALLVCPGSTATPFFDVAGSVDVKRARSSPVRGTRRSAWPSRLCDHHAAAAAR